MASRLLPFPVTILLALLIGLALGRGGSGSAPAETAPSTLGIALACLALWWAPVLVALLALGPDHLLVEIGLFLLEACSADLRRSLCGAGLAGRGRCCAGLGERPRDDGWAWPCRDDSGPDHSCQPVHRHAGGCARRYTFRAMAWCGACRADGALDHIRAVFPVDFRRRTASITDRGRTAPRSALAGVTAASSASSPRWHSGSSYRRCSPCLSGSRSARRTSWFPTSPVSIRAWRRSRQSPPAADAGTALAALAILLMALLGLGVATLFP